LTERKNFDLNFEIVQEAWNTYTLEDNAKLRARAIVSRFFSAPSPTDPPMESFGGDTSVISVVLPSKDYEFYGEPDLSAHSKNEIDSDEKTEVEFSNSSEEWNVYKIEDGTKIKVKLVIASIRRCKNLRDKDGIPIYSLDTSVIVHKEDPKK